MRPAAATNDRRWRSAGGRGLRLLVADDDEAVRDLYVTLLEEVDGVGSVVSAADGIEAVQLARVTRFDVAVLDLNMPRLDGVTAAVAIAALQPALAIAVHSTDPDELRRRAGRLGLVLFDKLQFDGLVSWVTDQAQDDHAADLPPSTRAGRDHSCARCGYGVATNPPPQRCPMCQVETTWLGAPTARVR